MDVIDQDAKFEVGAEKWRRRAERRDARRLHWRCFWTRPYGHAWQSVEVPNPRILRRQCVGCGWVRTEHLY